jgi:hypothetical protein
VGVVADVLARVVELEAQRAELSVERLRHHLEETRVHGPCRDERDELLQVDPGARADRERLRGRGADRLGDEVVEQLDRVPGAGAADVEHVLGEGAQHRLEPGEHGGLGADHDVELAELGLGRRARERRVDEGHAGGGATLAQPRRRIGLAGRAVDDDQLAAALRAREQALLAAHRDLDLRRAGDAEEDDFRRRRERRRRARLGRAGGEQVGDALAIAVHRERERVALAEQVFRHAVAHEARGADESDLRHFVVSRSVRMPALCGVARRQAAQR